jgi:hypothetical protein
MANRDGRNVRQGPEPNQCSDFKDFLDTKLAIFKEADGPLQVDVTSHLLEAGPAYIWSLF